MQALMMALRLRFSRKPMRFYMRLSLAMPALRAAHAAALDAGRLPRTAALSGAPRVPGGTRGWRCSAFRGRFHRG